MKVLMKKFLAIILVIAISAMGIPQSFYSIAQTTETEEDSEVEDENAEEETDVDEDEDSEVEEESEEDYSVDHMMELEYEITSSWENHCNVEVTLQNISYEHIDDWEVCFDLEAEIEHIWNAKITAHEEEEYTVKNVGWNQDIPADGKVTFGMTVRYETDFEFPTNCYLTRERLEVEKEYSVTYKENSSWDGYVNGQIVITNNSDECIEDWKLHLSIKNVNAFENIWNAEILESDEEDVFKLDNANYNQNISPGQSVEFGFIAKTSGKVEISKAVLYEMSDDVRYVQGSFVEEDFDEENYVEYYDSEDFDTYEEYEAYLAESGATQNIQTYGRARTATPMILSRDAHVDTFLNFYKKNGEKIKEDKVIDEDDEIVKATQSYFFDDKGAFTIYAGKGAAKNIAYMTLGSESPQGYDIKQSSFLEMTNFAHGQTFEKLAIGKDKKQYFMFAGDTIGDGKLEKDKWAREIAFVKYKKIYDKLKNRDKINYSTNSKAIRRITDINCANKYGKSKGVVKRVDAALSSDKSVLAIWCSFVDGSIQVSLYKMKPIRNFIVNSKKNQVFSLRSEKAKKACISSYYTENKGDSSVHPSKSFQSIEVSNKVSGSKRKHYVYICGGNENSKEQNGLQISRFTMTEGTQTITNTRRIMVNPVRRSDDPVNIEEHNREIEGCHIVGNNLQFIITHSKTEGAVIKKDLQYICSIPKSDFTKETKY